jgi:hypoxanthine phosphoribosyltransferase
MTTIEQYISSSEISKKVQELAKSINQYYSDYSNNPVFANNNHISEENPLMVLVILKGSTIFFSDLVRQLDMPVTVEFISISSYGNDTESSGQIRFELDTRQSMTGRHVLVVEDIIDTGNSLNAVVKLLETRNPKSMEIVCLLDKPSRRQTEVYVHWTGFKIEDRFVIGYGLDYAEHYRELPYIGILQSMGPRVLE